MPSPPFSASALLSAMNERETKGTAHQKRKEPAPVDELGDALALLLRKRLAVGLEGRLGHGDLISPAALLRLLTRLLLRHAHKADL